MILLASGGEKDEEEDGKDEEDEKEEEEEVKEGCLASTLNIPLVTFIFIKSFTVSATPLTATLPLPLELELSIPDTPLFPPIIKKS